MVIIDLNELRRNHGKFGWNVLKKIIIPELTLLSSDQNRRELTLFSNPLLLSEMKDL